MFNLMKRKIFTPVLMFLCFNVIIFLLTGCARENNSSTVKINNEVFQVELARTAEEQTKGLSNRESLADKTGMLFVFNDYQIRNFWMRGMNFPLDIVWIKDDQVVGCENKVKVFQTDGQISSISSLEPVNYVLEINSGLCEKYGLEKGVEVDIKIR